MAAPDRIERLLDSLPLADRIAQLVMPWVAGGYAAADDPAFVRAERWVDSLHVGGVIVSIGPPTELAAKLNRLQQRARIPLLVASDLESGTSFRLAGGTPFPPNMGVAAGGRDADAYEIGRVTALEGRAVGIHLAFAPVADVNSNPANPIINTRSFGEDPALVARFVRAAVRGLEDHGMMATVKHFPGHGDTDVDSHLALPHLGADWSRLDAVELVPFRAAVAAGVTGVMSGHIALPGIALPDRPATLAPSVLTGVLRDSLGFRGLTVTDAMNMAGVAGTFGAGEAAVLALEAGADLLLQPADPAEVIAAVESAVRSGRLSEERIDRSARRILELKQRAGLFQRRYVTLDRVADVVGRRPFLDSARAIAARSVVLVRDGGVLDSLRARARTVAVVSFADDVTSPAGTTLAAELRRGGHTVTLLRLWPASGPASYDSARNALARAEVGIVAAAVRFAAGRGTLGMPQALADLLQGAGPRTALVALGSPYLLLQAPNVSTYLLGWAANEISEAAVAQALLGAAPITGRLPVSLPPYHPAGHGIDKPAKAGPAHRPTTGRE